MAKAPGVGLADQPVKRSPQQSEQEEAGDAGAHHIRIDLGRAKNEMEEIRDDEAEEESRAGQKDGRRHQFRAEVIDGLGGQAGNDQGECDEKS